ncbi:MAG: hypothetical protein ABR968_10065 [Bacteroidales bacterium]|jgi:hypothetical protein
MKKILSVFLLLIFLFNLAGYFIVFKIMQCSVQQEMKNYLEKNTSNKETETIVIPDSEITSPSSRIKFTDDDEFIYNGKMYDIISRKTEKGFTIFYCMNDKQEEQLYSALKDHIMHNSDQNLPLKDKSNLIIKNIIKEALPDGNAHLQTFSSKNIIYYSSYNSATHQSFISVITPPPKS